jgi:hypothetical protein
MSIWVVSLDLQQKPHKWFAQFLKMILDALELKHIFMHLPTHVN